MDTSNHPGPVASGPSCLFAAWWQHAGWLAVDTTLHAPPSHWLERDTLGSLPATMAVSILEDPACSHWLGSDTGWGRPPFVYRVNTNLNIENPEP